MVIRGEYQYVVVRNQNRYDMDAAIVVGHPFSYEKRRRVTNPTQTKYSEFRPFCNCKWKSKIWWTSKKAAIGEHWRHAMEYQEPAQLPIEGMSNEN